MPSVPSRGPDADAGLLDRVRRGDIVAFEALFHAHWTALCTAAAVYTHDMAEAEEIVAAIFADLWARRADLHVTVSARTYLHSAVKHRTVNWRRDRERRDRLTQRAAPGEVPGMGETIPSPHATLEADDTLVHALGAVDALPDRYRLAFIYRWHEGWDYTDIADALGVSTATAHTLVSRALKMIRAQVDGR